MIVNLNDKKFKSAKQGDIFVIEIVDGVKVAVPIAKKEILKCEIRTLEKQQEQINELKNQLKNQDEKIANLEEIVKVFSKSIYNFVNIMKGDNSNEKDI